MFGQLFFMTYTITGREQKNVFPNNIKPKFEVDDWVWVWMYRFPGISLTGKKMEPDCRRIESIEFNEDEDIVYNMEKYRCACPFRYLEGQCFETKEELLKYKP